MEYDPCGQDTEGRTGISKLMKFQGKTSYDDEEFDLMEVLKSNAIKDAIWCLRCFDYLDYSLFNADVVESVLHIYEHKNNSKTPRLAIKAIRDFKLGVITSVELFSASYAAADVAYAVDAASYAVDTVAYAAYAAAYAASIYSYAETAAHAVPTNYVNVNVAEYSSAADRKSKWNEIEQIFIKHFGSKL